MSYYGRGYWFLVLLCAVVLVSSVMALEYNDPLPAVYATQNSFSLGFDPNLYDFLIYDCGGGEIQMAMTVLGIPYTVRNNFNPVTEQDLINYDILIVGWKGYYPEGTRGLNPDIIRDGITGRVILTGHDTDFHTFANLPAAKTFLSQCIEYVLAGGGTGLIAHGEPQEGFDWLPESWGINVRDNLAEEQITAFTQDGIDSGIFDGLTPQSMSNWKQSFHNIFDSFGIGFRAFEMGLVNDANSVVTIATPYNSMTGFPLIKTDDVSDGDCREAGDTITYTISWTNTTGQAFYDVWLIDYLPAGATYPQGQWTYDPNFVLLPPDPGYDSNTHTYIWQIGTVAANQSGSVTLTVTVNDKAEPGLNLHNVVEMYAGQTLITRDSEDTPVCCGDVGPVIYVDWTASGNNNGTSWADAYTDLQKALTRARFSTCEDVNYIYVAQGTYYPGAKQYHRFGIPDGVSVYGGFKSGGSEPALRDPKRYPTVLSGYINSTVRNESVVAMGNNTLLDGFIVQDSDGSPAGQGILCQDIDSAEIANCIIKDNLKYGVYADNSSLSIKWCTFEKNGWDGIRHIGNTKNCVIENSNIIHNLQHGIYLRDSIATIRNNRICNNSLEDTIYYAITIRNPKSAPSIYNNTVAYNRNEAFFYLDSDPNRVNYPEVKNCIIWYNNQDGNGEQFAGLKLHPYYSCVYDPNDPDGVNYTMNFRHTFGGKPGFVYEGDPNNVHLGYTSFCKNQGDPNLSYPGQKDMDNEDRVADNRADIGADEVHCEDIANAWDLDHDGLVNYVEFVPFSKAWLSRDPDDPELNDPNYPNYYLYNDPNGPYYITPQRRAAWREEFNLVNTGSSQYAIDLPDFLAWMETSDCLWIACWRPEFHPLDYTPPISESTLQSMSASSLSAPSLMRASVLSTESAEDEASLVLSLLDQINLFIKTDQDNTEIWQEVKNLLEQSLVETADTTIKTQSF